jgi:mono/diheme cytochrome c family protein
MIVRFLLLASCLSPLPSMAQDGGQLYTLYCSACHGADGAGATGGAFPPLAGSPWVAGDPDRAVKIVLHGLHGPIDVAGKTYNLEMPPQGAMLPDEQIAAILTHVRSSWGNQSGPVKTDLVKGIRAANSGRQSHWTAEELLKLHPLPLEKTALHDLISSTYEGKWNSIPDFTTLQPNSVEEEHNGIISLKDQAKKDGFAKVWEGKFEAPVAGVYEFLLDADDAARVLVDGTIIAEIKGSGPMGGSRKKGAKLKLTKGEHAFRVEYLEIAGQEGIVIGWIQPGTREWKWLTDPTDLTPYTRKPILIQPSEGRPAIYRNFISGTTPRAIGFGFPGGVNLAYSADHLGPELMWTGNFMDGAHHWTDRGVGNEPPAGEAIITLAKSSALPKGSRFRGYKLDATGNPTFSVQIGEQVLLDSWRAESKALVRTLKLSGNGNLPILLGEKMTQSGNELAISPFFTLDAPGASVELKDGTASLLLVPNKPVTVTYRWKH